MSWTVHSLTTATGTSNLEVFLEGLKDDDASDEAHNLIEALAEHGSTLRKPLSEAMGDGLFEARGLSSGVRLYYIFAGDRRIIVLDGYVKKRTSVPTSVMRRMRRLQKQADKAIEGEKRPKRKQR